jgi:hypothetical protein
MRHRRFDVEPLEPRLHLWAADVDFRPTGSGPFPGYLADDGAAYGDRGNGFAYGWLAGGGPAANPHAIDRNEHELSPDGRHDTHVLMQSAEAEYAWEIDVPRGPYQVRVVMGDPLSTDALYRVNVEGETVVDGAPTALDPFVEGTATVRVPDGKLTISAASGARNNAIAFVQVRDVRSVAPPAAPVDLVAVSAGSTAVDVRWRAGSPPDDASVAAATYDVERRALAGGPWEHVALVGSGQSVFTDTSAGAGFAYRVRAANAGGESAFSNEVAVTAPATPALPGTVQAEEFDAGGEGVGYHDLDGINAGGLYRGGGVDVVRGNNRGGHAIGSARAGEWAQYTIHVPAAGNYWLEAVVASAGPGGTFHVEFNGQVVTGAMQVVDTGSHFAFRTVGAAVSLAAGTQVMRVAFDADGPAGSVGHFDLFRFTAVPAAPASVTAVAVSPTATRVSWADGSADESGFVVQYAASADFANATSVEAPPDVATLDVPVPSHGTRWQYRVLAVNRAGQSAAPPSAAVEQVFVRDFGAAGDGVVDDRPAIQAAIDAANHGAVLVFDPGRTYRLDAGLVVRKRLHVEAQGATLKMNSSSIPQNITFFVESQYSPQVYEWAGQVAAGESTFQVAVPPEEMRPGDLVFVELGDDPYDSEPIEPGRKWIEHFSAIARVVENTGSSVTLDTATPYAIQQGSGDQYRPHRIRRITGLVEDVWFHDVRFDHFEGATPNSQVHLQTVRNVRVQTVRGRFTLVLSAWDSDDVLLSDVAGELPSFPNHSADGRILTSLQSDRVRVENAEVTTYVDAPFVYVESWARETVGNNLTVHWRVPRRTTADVLNFTGGSTGSFVDNLVVDNAGYGEINLADKGGPGAVAQWRLGRVRVTGPVFAAQLNDVDSLTVDGHTFDVTRVATETFAVPLDAGWSGHPVAQIRGVVRKSTFRLSNANGAPLDPAVRDAITSILLVNNNGQGGDVTSRPELFTGADVSFPAGYGSVDPFNATDGMEKRLSITTTPALPPGVLLTVTVEYWRES